MHAHICGKRTGYKYNLPQSVGMIKKLLLELLLIFYLRLLNYIVIIIIIIVIIIIIITIRVSWARDWWRQPGMFEHLHF